MTRAVDWEGVEPFALRFTMISRMLDMLADHHLLDGPEADALRGVGELARLSAAELDALERRGPSRPD